jgi:small conductance mechanosensitive channel
MDPEQIQQLVNTYVIPWGIKIVLALVIFFIGRWVAKLVTRLAQRLMKRSGMDDMLVNFIGSILGGILILVVIIAALDQLGVDTTSLIALIGAAGLAIGLALQDSLKNFSSGVMLIVFRPFTTGNFVEAGGTMGIVEKITIFNTVMRTPDNREVIVPNGAIYGGTITNYSARDTRRVDMVFGVSYDDDIKKTKQILERLVGEDERILEDPAPQVALSELADSSVNFVVRPWVKAEDYWAVKFDYTEKVKLTFDAEGISIPYPQMDVHLPDKQVA